MPNESTQKKLQRVRPARVAITYDKAGEAVELPFVVGVLAPLSGNEARSDRLKERRFQPTTWETFDSVLGEINPRLSLDVEHTLAGGGTLRVQLSFQTMADFEPGKVARQVEPLRLLLEKRSRLLEILRELRYDDLRRHDAALLRIQERATLLAPEIVWQDLDAESMEAELNRIIAELDSDLSAQLNEIMHHKEFQLLEAAWRGLEYLVLHTETSERLRIEVFDVTKKELQRDLDRPPELDQSSLFQRVHERFDLAGGNPFSVLVGSFEFGRHGEDFRTLEKLAAVAAKAHCPFIASVSADMFALESFTALDQPRDLAKHTGATDLVPWIALRNTADANHLALTLPRVLMRVPYGRRTIAVEEFDYDEQVSASYHDRYLWGSAAFFLGACITRAFTLYGWCANIRGYEGGGLIEDLPVHSFVTESGHAEIKCTTETPITDRREKELADLGFVSLVHSKDTSSAVFFSVPSVHRAPTYVTEAATANARVAAQLPCVLVTDRFAQYLKVMMRDGAGVGLSRVECERFLNRWLAQYVATDHYANKAKFPLRQGEVEVHDIVGTPGAFKAVVSLWPHFQLEELSGPIRVHVLLSPGADRSREGKVSSE